MEFKLWSELNNDAKQYLKPDLGLREWNLLSDDEKSRIWKYLERYFFNPTTRTGYDVGEYFEFELDYQAEERVVLAVQRISQLYKQRNFASFYLKEKSKHAAASDFHSIFMKAESSVVYELLSLYCQVILWQRKDKFFDSHWIPEEVRTEEHMKNKLVWEFEEFDEFAEDLNDVFGDFGLNVFLTRGGFIPKQEQKIIEEVYEPTLRCLSDARWEKVSSLLAEAFDEYRKNTPKGFSVCVTHSVAAVEALLQIIVNGKTGEGNFAALVSEGQQNGLIPSDMFTKAVFSSIISTLMIERKKTGVAHVSESFANENNSKMVLNLSLIFIQHCIVR